MLRKVGLIPVCLGLACFTAGLFGALHNQVSFTAGPAYFHDLKFAQFRIPASTPDRWGAAQVGWKASWWMGLILGTPMAAAALRHRAMLRVFCTGIFVTLCIAALCATGGLGLALWLGEPWIASNLRVENIYAPGFLTAAAMHDASYLGGGLGLLVALVVTWRRR